MIFIGFNYATKMAFLPLSNIIIATVIGGSQKRLCKKRDEDVQSMNVCIGQVCVHSRKY